MRLSAAALAVPALFLAGCGCKRPGVVHEPRLASVSIKVAAQGSAGQMKLGDKFLFGAPAQNQTPEGLAQLVAEMNKACGTEAAPCVSGIVPLAWAAPTGVGAAAAGPDARPHEMLVCAETEQDASGRTRTAPGFTAFMAAVDANTRSAPGQMAFEKHYVFDYAPPPPTSRDVDADALAFAAKTTNSSWALTQINYSRAEQLIREKRHEAPGLGIVVAHMDTGYTQNCHTFSEDPNGPVKPALGYDFFLCKPDPRDPLLKPELPESRQPGHGTATSSTMIGPHVAPTGCAARDFAEVRGVAPAATLVPIRVTDGILLGLPHPTKQIFEKLGHVDIDHRVKALAAAIENAARTGGLIGKTPHVISMSMGGVCAECAEEKASNESLQEAVRYAERTGIIVIAAAGQYPIPNFARRLFFRNYPVTFPGSYPSSIAVAGSTIFGTPWKKSSRGRQVGVTAPAYGVWRSETTPDGMRDVGTGAGTSFATAITAGVAGLWVQYHTREELWKQYGPALASAFRWILGHGGARSPKALCQDLKDEDYKSRVCDAARTSTWNSNEWGPGLLDAAGLLATPLPTREVVCAAEKLRRQDPSDPKWLARWRDVCPEVWPPRI